MKFWYTQLGVTGNSLYWIMWEAVRRLEEINLKVTLMEKMLGNS